MASNGPWTAIGRVSPVIYRAEVYRDTDQFREPVWRCAHEHRTVEGALNCGNDWMYAQPESA